VLEGDEPRSTVFFFWPTAPFYSDDDITLDVTANLVRKRMFDKLIVERKVATRIGVLQSSASLGSYFFTYATPADGHDVDEMRGLMEEEIRALATNSPTAIETVNASAKYAATYALGHVSLKDRALHIANCQQALGDPTFHDKYIAAYLTATPTGVQKAVTKYLHTKNRVVVTMMPKKGASGEKKP
jgi:predicted Zn-dependent peptidase